jgi:hypothetical protein
MSAGKKRQADTKRALTRRRNAARRRANLRANPLGRLYTDGAVQVPNIRRRLQWLAHVWQIPAEDLPEIKRTPTKELVDFAEKYGVSFNWLLGGGLKDLQQMMRDREERARGRPAQTERIMAKYRALTPEERQIVDTHTHT